jgi:NAD-dependent deacetylase
MIEVIGMELKSIIEQSENIVFFGGAGVSTESGIPDFRSPSGIYACKNTYGVEPERILSHDYFLSETERFYKFYKNSIIYEDPRW